MTAAKRRKMTAPRVSPGGGLVYYLLQLNFRGTKK